jgi:SAM-dependent methyltransferase
MSRGVESGSAVAFWEARYATGLVYGTEPTSVAGHLVGVFRAHGVRRVLEAGCGSGRDALLYAREGFEVTGTEISENALRWARERAQAEGLRLTLLRDDLAETRLPPESFDATVAIHLIHLQPAPVRQTMVNQLWRLTRDGGLIAMANYSTHEAGFTTWDIHREPNTRVDPKGKLVHFFDREDLAALLLPDRFDLLTFEEVDLAEVPDGGPVTHREWLTIARKIRAC